MCLLCLTGLVCGEDGERNSCGIGSIGVEGLFLKTKIRVRFMLKASASFFWYASLDGEITARFSLPFLPSVSM